MQGVIAGGLAGLPGHPAHLGGELGSQDWMISVLMGEGSPGVPESLHVATLAVTVLTPVDVVSVCPHHGPSPQLGLQLPVVDEQPLVDLSLAAQGSLQLVNTVNCMHDLFVVCILLLQSGNIRIIIF